MKKIITLLRVIGIIIIVSPLLLISIMRMNHDIYISIISGPYPFNMFGGGPFLMLLILICAIVGTLLIASTWYLSSLSKKNSDRSL